MSEEVSGKKIVAILRGDLRQFPYQPGDEFHPSPARARQTKESVGVNGIGEAFEPYQNWHIQTPAPGFISLSGEFQVC